MGTEVHSLLLGFFVQPFDPLAQGGPALNNLAPVVVQHPSLSDASPFLLRFFSPLFFVAVCTGRLRGNTSVPMFAHHLSLSDKSLFVAPRFFLAFDRRAQGALVVTPSRRCSQ